MSALGQLKASYINIHETKEIIFHRPAARNLSIPPSVPRIERVKQAKLLGLMLRTLFTAAYVDRLYLCKLIIACTSYPFFNPPVYNALRCISSLMLW